jgi:transglutaminase-like putative cysteine protease
VERLPAVFRRLLRGPAEGWLTLLLVTLLALTVAWSFDDAAWVLSEKSWGDFYAPTAVLGVLFGFVGAKTRWPRWLSHLIGAMAAAIIVPLFVGAIVLPAGNPYEQFRATATSVTNAWIDLAVNNGSITREFGHFLLTIGLLVWSVGQFAAYAVFGHRRPLDAVIVVGLVLLSSIALTANDQLGFLVVFSIAGLGLLARSHAFDEQSAWVRRRIGDASSVRSLYLRGGTAFIVLAVAGSLVLTATASSAPLQGRLTEVSERLYDVSQWLQRYLPIGGNSRPGAAGFGATAKIQGQWTTTGAPTATVILPQGENEKFYWRAVTYDQFSGDAWTWSESRDLGREPGESILQGLADDPERLGARRPVQFTITIDGTDYGVSPGEPEFVNQETSLVALGNGGYFGGLRMPWNSGTYVVSALVPIEDDVPGGRTIEALRAAGRAYPPEIVEKFTTKYGLGPEPLAILEDVLADTGDNPYDLARGLERYLASNAFQYQSNMNIYPDCLTLGAVECFARYRAGYCLHYASTMAVLLRQMGIPTRLAEGYLPGRRVGTREQLTGDQLHAWVEVYFPGFGWFKFDPTGGGVGEQSEPPTGTTPTARPSIAPLQSFPGDGRDFPSFRPTPGGGGTTGGGGGNASGLLIIFAVVLLIAVGSIVFVAWERGPRGEVTPDSVWRGVARLASRLGFGPRPTQTVYEFAGSLGEVLPSARPELQTVARAKVEVAYGRHVLGEDRMRGLKEAHRRLRRELLSLIFRRRERKARKASRRGRLR